MEGAAAGVSLTPDLGDHVPVRGDHDRPLSEAERVARALASGGEPITRMGSSGNPYVNYLAVDVLLSLQHARTAAPAEPTFLVTHQVVELLLKLAHGELVEISRCLENDDVLGTLWVFRRLRRLYGVVLGAWEMLSSLSPREYAEFRDQLGEASGFQSYSYRLVDFRLGLKNAALLEMHRGDPSAHAELTRAMQEPSVYDQALRLLRRRGLSVPEEVAERDWARPYRDRDEVAAAWREIYAGGHRQADLHQLAEAMVDLAYDAGRWRAAHVLNVERLIGHKVGSAGTSGADWLRRLADHRFFPELWAVRSAI